MRFRSVYWDREIRQSGVRKTLVQAWQGSQYTELNVLSGKGTETYTDATRFSYDFQIIDPQRRTYQTVYSQLDVKKTRFVRYLGVQYAGGSTEYMLMGHFYPESVRLSGEHGGDPVYTIKAFDASFVCGKPLTVPYYIESGQQLTVAVPKLLSQKLATLTYRLGSSPWTTPSLLITDEDNPWQEASRLYAASGFDLHMARDNTVVADPRRTTATSFEFSWHFHEGEYGDCWDVQRDTGNDGYPNAIRVIGTNPAVAGISGMARDSNPNSPTYYRGDYGEQTKTIRSEVVTSNDQANAMARTELFRELGPQDKITLKALPNPALEVGDVALVTSTKTGLDRTPVIVSKIETNDGAQEMGVELMRSVVATV